jgi:glycosyltransferase involved in cell wall biosynthesis
VVLVAKEIRAMSVPKLAVICDLAEENWPSMDLFGEMLLHYLQTGHAAEIMAERVRPKMVRRFGRLPLLGRHRIAYNADRLVNRFWDYPRHLSGFVRGMDLFHICDHSYAQLIHQLPAERTGVFCHDLDTFRCLLEPTVERRPCWFRAMTRRILDGFQKAAVVFYSTASVRRQIEQYGLVDAERLVHAPYGFAAEFTPEPAATDAAAVLDLAGGAPYLLHVGSCIPRKRIDVLLDVFAGVRARWPGIKLVQVGGSWTAAQQAQLARLDLAADVRQVRGLDRSVLAGLYRGARLVLVPSEAEGFGLPVIEALACGAIVVASDLPVLREVGGDAVVYCPVADLDAWVATVERLLSDPAAAPTHDVRLAQAGRYSWAAQAQTIVGAYQQLLAGSRLGSRRSLACGVGALSL